MIFNSWRFAFFLPTVFVIHWALPHKYRWIVLVASSWLFYAFCSVQYLFILIGLTGVTYILGIKIESAENRRLKKVFFLCAVCVCVGALAIFKYLDFFNQSVTDAFALLGVHFHVRNLKLLLPVGMSFYILQMVGYTADIYMNKIRAEKHLGYYALFASFFPQLLSGPIARGGQLLPQLKAQKTPQAELLTEGGKLMLWGYFKKCVVGDNLAFFVDRVYSNPPAYQGFALMLAAVLYSVQIYCDFSGYSDIAIGTARLFGIRLAENFRQPYLSSSIKEFWSRWHISLSTWFRDYVYIPLGGNRVKKTREYLNLIVTFLVSGLWHGANWTFVIWGGLHGMARVAEKLLGRKMPKKQKTAWKPVRIAFVFLLVTLAWIFFRANNLKDAFYIITHMFIGLNSPVRYLEDGLLSIALGRKLLICMMIFYFFPLVIYDLSQLNEDKQEGRPPSHFAEWVLYICRNQHSALCPQRCTCGIHLCTVLRI